MKTSNDLRHTIETTDKDGNQLQIKISLNDECNNGHQDFSIIGSIWEAGKPLIDRYSLGSGCIHDQIVKARPDLQIFVNLHLCDYTGVPIYAVANGFYHLSQQMNNYNAGTKEHTKRYCEYYRISPKQFNELKKAENEIRFAILLDKLGILKQWKEEADKAIKVMEEMTGEKFLVDSKRTQYKAPTPKQIREEEQKESEGFYTPNKIAERSEKAKQEAIDKEYEEIVTERDKEIFKAQKEYQVKKAVLDGGLSLDNFIFYAHTNEGCFKWNTSNEKVSQKEFNKFLKVVKKIRGVKFKLK